MQANLQLTIVTPERKLLVRHQIDELFVPAFKGELNILPGHAPLITTLETGVLKWREKGESEVQKAAISWGYCQVGPTGLVSVLADLVQLPSEVEYKTELEVIADSEKRLGSESLDDYQWSNTQREIARARAAIDILPATKKV